MVHSVMSLVALQHMYDHERKLRQQKKRVVREGPGREELERNIRSELLAWYLRVRTQHEDALVPHKEGYCSRCAARISSRLLCDMRNNGELVACEACGRILYDPEALSRRA